MRFLVFAFLAQIVAIPAAVAAEEGAIRIIREDGSVTEYSLPEGAVVAPASAPLSTPEPAPAVIAAPEPVSPPPVLQKEPEQKAAIKKKQRPEPQIARREGPPVPGRKPALMEKIVETAAELPPDQAIPQSLAVSIAINHAPPAKDFRVTRQVYRDIPVYAVIFETEEGPYSVLVEARSGKIVDAE